MKKKYDYLIVGSGLYGSVFAQQAKAAGKSVLVIEKRPNIAGNIYTEKVEGINFHKYGAHMFVGNKFVTSCPYSIYCIIMRINRPFYADFCIFLPRLPVLFFTPH